MDDVRDFMEVMDDSEKVGLGMQALAERRVREFKPKLRRFMGLIANESGHSSHKRRYLMKEAETTSDFPLLFGTVLERTLLAKYKIMVPTYTQYVQTGVQNDFRPANAFGVWGLQSALPAVAERGEYKADKLNEGRVSIQLQKYGRRFPISWEAVINDDLGVFNDVAERLANAARRTEWKVATGAFVTSAGPSTSLFGDALTHPLDGVVIDNHDTLTFSADNLAKTINVMYQQLDAEGEPVMFDGFTLVYGPRLQNRVQEALSNAALIATALGSTSAAARSTSYNIVSAMNITPVMNPYLPIIDTSGNKDFTWYVFGNLSNGVAVKLNRLRGHETPEVVMKASNIQNGNPMDGDFENDTIEWRVRDVMGAGIVDPRMAYVNVASS